MRQGRGSARGLLVLSDAQDLTINVLNGLLSLHDAILTGLVLIGSDRLQDRLPTKAEWEYTARAWTTGDLDAVAWSEDTTDDKKPAEHKVPTMSGPYDMLRNVRA